MSYRFRGRVALVLAALSAAVVWAAEGEAPSISPQELEARIAAGRAPLVVDVRSPQEFAAGHIPGAINVPYEEVGQRASELRGRGEVAMYCMKGPRARLGEVAFLKAGGESVLHVEGGYSAWAAAGLPVAKGAGPD
jgi:rhodanese-related sulfurtransferase